MVKYRNALKYTAASMLLISLFLPMSSCSYTVPLELGVDETSPETEKVGTETRTVIMYAWEYNDLREPGSWFNLLSFIWPFLLIALQLSYRGRWARIVLPSAGVSLCAVSAVVIYLWADVGKPLIGAYVGWCAAAGLFVIYLSELVGGLKGGKKV